MNPIAMYQGAKAAYDVIKQLGGDATAILKKLAGNWLEVNDAAFKTARTMALGREQALAYNKQLLQATKDLAAQFGVTAKELADFQKSYSEAVGRNVTLSKEQLAHMSVLSKIAGDNAGRLVDEFDKVGVGIARATAYTGRLQERAKALGVSPSKATKIMADNIKLAASYSFKNGVNDIEKMSLRAAAMRLDMQSIMNATEKFANIESAISTSANIQMLGGSFAREFSNPMGAMYESMADPAAFQERILRTIQGKGSYDAKTGAVTFDPVTMRMMREMASQLGMSAQELNTAAMASVQEAEVEKELNRAGKGNKWDPVQLAAIKNLSRTNVDVETGKHFVTLLNDGKEERVNIEDLTEEQLKIAQDSQMTEEGLWNDVADIKTILERVHGRARETVSTKEQMEGVGEWWRTFRADLSNGILAPLSNAFNSLTNSLLGEQYFASGGIAKPLHAEVGTIVPGNSYYGDKVPAMLNSGEMVLNQNQQKSMFSLISSLALNGGMMYGMNKLGGKVGVGGLGSTMLMANMIGGEDAGVKEIIEAHFLKKFIKNMMPLKKSIDGVSTAAETATKTTSAFKTNWGEFTSTLSKDWSKLTKKVSSATKTFFTTGRIGKVTSYVGARASQAGAFTAKYAKIIGETVGKYTVKPIAKGAKALYNTKPIQGLVGKAQTVNYQAHLGYNQLVKPKVQEYSKLIKNLFNDGSKAQASKAASRLQTPEIAMTGRKTDVTKVAETASKEVSTVAKAAGNSGKMFSGLKTAGKMIGKKIPYLGAALAVGGAVSNMMTASSQYDDKIDKIESSNMSDYEKARAKDRATKEKNASYGGAVGSAAGGLGGMAAGAAAGAAIGSVIPVVGTAIGGLIGGALGAWGGEKLGGTVGKGVGSLFGGSEEEELKKREEAKIKAENKETEAKAKALMSIDKNVEKIASGGGIGVKSLKLPSISPLFMGVGLGAGMLKAGIEALPFTNNFMKVKPTSGSDKGSNKTGGISPSEIKLNVSGTIKLEGAGKSADFDLAKLLDTPEFKRQLTDIISRRLNENSNSGKRNMESERNNMATQYNKSGK